ncbi:MAG: hypothetical protein H0U07_10790 [Actinobacteria bacterium]|nr:hypothetical protein [Actinomycetota bacterium]
MTTNIRRLAFTGLARRVLCGAHRPDRVRAVYAGELPAAALQCGVLSAASDRP